MKINNKRLIILLIVIAVIVAIIVGIVIHNNKEDDKKENSSKTTFNLFEMDIEGNLRALAIDFYENFYWPQVTKKGTNKKILENYKKTGIKIDVNNLDSWTSDNDEIVAKLVNGQTKEACDREKTKVIITPEEPYDKDDYRIETIISCGLEEK